MLFTIDDDFIGHIQEVSEEDLHFFERMGNGLIEGSVSLFTTRYTLSILKELCILSTKSKGIYYKLYQSFPQLKAYYDSVDILICICFSEYRVDKINGKTIIYLPYKDIHPDLFDLPVVIGENLEDVRFFEFISRWYAKKVSNPTYKPAIRRYPGGGSTIAKALEESLSQTSTPVLCFSDSDKKWPGYPSQGSTAKVLMKSWHKMCKIHDRRSAWCKTEVLENVKEVENLIPIKIIRDLCEHQDRVVYQDFLNFINKIEQNNLLHLLLYYDFKNGLKIAEIKKYRAGKEYYQQLLKCSDYQSSVENIYLTQSEDDETMLIPNAVNKLVAKTLDYLESTEVYVPKYLEQEWNNIGACIYSFTLGSSICYRGT